MDYFELKLQKDTSSHWGHGNHSRSPGEFTNLKRIKVSELFKFLFCKPLWNKRKKFTGKGLTCRKRGKNEYTLITMDSLHIENSR